MIPAVVSVRTDLRTGGEKKFRMPKKCPECGSRRRKGRRPGRGALREQSMPGAVAAADRALRVTRRDGYRRTGRSDGRPAGRRQNAAGCERHLRAERRHAGRTRAHGRKERQQFAGSDRAQQIATALAPPLRARNSACGSKRVARAGRSFSKPRRDHESSVEELQRIPDVGEVVGAEHPRFLSRAGKPRDDRETAAGGSAIQSRGENARTLRRQR